MDGSVQTMPAVEYRFISGAQAHQQLTRVLLWIGGALVGTMILVAVIQALFFKRKKISPRLEGGQRGYGLLGGTVCPKCGYTFPRHLWGINLLVGRLDRCEHCGKWVMTRRASQEELRSAEKAVLEEVRAEENTTLSQHDERDLLEETKYIDKL